MDPNAAGWPIPQLNGSNGSPSSIPRWRPKVAKQPSLLDVRDSARPRPQSMSPRSKSPRRQAHKKNRNKSPASPLILSRPVAGLARPEMQQRKDPFIAKVAIVQRSVRHHLFRKRMHDSACMRAWIVLDRHDQLRVHRNQALQEQMAQALATVTGVKPEKNEESCPSCTASNKGSANARLWRRRKNSPYAGYQKNIQPAVACANDSDEIASRFNKPPGLANEGGFARMDGQQVR